MSNLHKQPITIDWNLELENVVEKYEPLLFKLNTLAVIHPYIIIGSKNNIFIYLLLNINKIKLIKQFTLHSEINYITKYKDLYILIVGENGLVYYLKKNINFSKIEDSFQLIEIFKNGNESTWSISLFNGITAIGDNSHIIKIQHLKENLKLEESQLENKQENEEEENNTTTTIENFQLIGHKHNLPHLDCYSENRLLSCSIDGTCKIWDINERKILYESSFLKGDWIWLGKRLSKRYFRKYYSSSIISNQNTIMEVSMFKKDKEEDNLFFIGTKNYIYLLNYNLSKIYYKLFFKPTRAYGVVPNWAIDSLDRITLFEIIPELNLICLAKQNDTKVILFKMICTKIENNEEEEENDYQLVPIEILPKKDISNTLIVSISYDKNRLFILCLDKTLYIYRLDNIVKDCLDEILI
ncbi:hypothetical protein ABK040_012987 [Willaertia magna]